MAETEAALNDDEIGVNVAPRYTPRRRNVRRTSELEERILERVAAGESLRKVCDAKGMPDPAAVRYWAVTDSDFAARLTAARVCQAHEWFDLIREELARPPAMTEDGKTDHGEIQLRRLRCDMWRWGLSKLLPRTFGDKITLAGDPHAPLRVMSDDEAMGEILGLLARAKGRQLAGERPCRGAVADDNDDNGQQPQARWKGKARELPTPASAPAPTPQPRGPLDAIPTELVRRAQERWEPRSRPGPGDVLAIVDDGHGGVALARRHGGWIAPTTTRLQDHTLVDELQAERVPIIVDGGGYGTLLLKMLRDRGMSVTEGDIDQGLGRFLEALGATTVTGKPATPLALPPALIATEMRAVVLTFMSVSVQPVPSFFDDPSLRRYDPVDREDDLL